MVLGPASHLDGYDTSIDMDEVEWNTFLANLKRLQDVVQKNGLTTGLHPHWGMAIERPDHIERLLDSCDVNLCLDTGHLFLVGADLVEVAKSAAGRVVHVHLKDVDAGFAERVRAGETGFKQAVVDGLFRPLGRGDVDIAGLIRELEAAGFDKWYVIEQDTSLTGEPAPGQGPKADAALSVRFLETLAEKL